MQNLFPDISAISQQTFPFALKNMFRTDEKKTFLPRCQMDGLCLTHGSPPAPGTPCGKHKWCQNGKCVQIGDPEGSNPTSSSSLSRKIHGQWSEWSNWGPCSRKCGTGVQISSRECDNPAPQNGGRFCSGTGDRKRKRVCQTGSECTVGVMKELDAQCAQFALSSEREDLEGAYMHALRNPTNPCHMQCIPVSVCRLACFRNFAQHQKSQKLCPFVTGRF